MREKSPGSILLNPFLLIGLVLGGPFLYSLATGGNVTFWVQVLVAASGIFAVWVGLTRYGAR
jgi:hypothetical protein